jgi:hypothetical protein
MRLLSLAFSLAMRKRLRQFAHDLRDPRAAQLASLRKILELNRDTVFGREHGFAGIRNFDEFRRRVPVRSYEQFLPLIERTAAGENDVLVPGRPEMFAVTSGTSSTPKLCPVTRAFTLEHHTAHLLWMYHLQQSHPAALDGRFLSLVSPAETGRTSGGIPFGASSGRQLLNQAVPVRRRQAVPYEACKIKDYNAKYYVSLLFALGCDISVAMSVNPSTLALLAEFLNANAEPLLDDLARGGLANVSGLSPEEKLEFKPLLKPNPRRTVALRERLKTDGRLLPRNAWPKIATIATWQGGSAPFYLSRLDETWGEAPRRCLGLRASEGTFSIPLADATPSGALAVGGHVLEFIEGEELPENPRTLLAHELEQGKRYRLVITTGGGFYRYDLADIVEVTGLRDATPEIAFLHKAGNVLSVTGEKVTEDQVVEVMRGLGRAKLRGFTVTLELSDLPRYLLAMEMAPEFYQQRPEDILREVLRSFETGLCAANEEYASKRASGRLGEPSLLLLAEGSYRRYREKLVAGGSPDGQVKPPHLVRSGSQTAFFSLVEIAGRVELNPSPPDNR